MVVSRRPIFWGLFLCLAALAGKAWGDGLAVDRVVVPPGRVSAVFPPGTEVRSLPLAEFERLLKAARRGMEGAHPAPRLLRADHVARWENGRLQGHSELVAEIPAGREEGVVVLSPWSPAIQDGGEGRIVSTTEGQTALWVAEGGRATVSVSWELAARSETQGRFFALALPACTASSLTLDLPDDLEPAVDPSRRSRPRPGPEPGRQRWVLSGATDASGLVLQSRSTPDDRPATGLGGCWVGGSTTITVEDEVARWVATWEVDRNSALADTLAIELDPSLVVEAVEGVQVVGFAVEPAARPLLRVRLRPGTSGSMSLTIRAQCRVPDEGAWSIPSARPLRSFWTGGRSTVTLRGTFRRLEATRALAGQPVPVRGEPAQAEPILAFDQPTPESPAELTFRRVEPEALAAVQGELRLGADAPWMAVRVTWTPVGSRLLSLAADVPGPWTIERVAVEGQAEEPSWQLEPRPGGATRLSVTPPAGLPADAAVTVRFEARAPVLPVAEGLVLPRVSPVDARLADDAWLARVAEGYVVRPREANGLVWINAESPEDAVATGARLGWRWNMPDGAARIDVTPVSPGPRGVVRQVVVVDSDQVRIEGKVAIDLGAEARRTLRVQEFGPLGEAPSWRWLEPAAGPLPVREVSRAGHRRVWELDLGRARRGRIGLAWRMEQPLGERSIPIISLLPEDMSRGVVLVAVDRSLRSTVRTEGLLAFNPDLASADLRAFDTEGSAEVLPRGARLAHALSHGPEPGSRRLELQAERLAPLGPIGVIRDVVLEETLEDAAPRQQRLSLRVAMSAAGMLDVTLPVSSVFQRVRVEGRAIVPTRDGKALSIPLPGPSANRPLANIVLEYSLPETQAPVGERHEAEWPVFSMPCLDYTWQVHTGEDREASGRPGAGLLAAIGHDPTLVERLFGSRASWDAFRRAFRRERKPATRAAGAQSASPAEGITLVDLLARWEVSGGAVIVDRLALQAAGLGPWSRLRGVSTDGVGLDRVGLRVEWIEGTRLLTTTATTPLTETLASDRIRVAREARAWGTDQSGRYLTARRWSVAPAPVEPEVTQGVLGSARASWVVGMGPGVPTLALETAPRWRAHGVRVAVLLGVLALGVARRRGSSARRGLLLATVAVGASLALVWGADSVASGLALGLVVTLSYWMGRGLRRPTTAADAASRLTGKGSTVVRSGTVRAGTALGLLLAPVLVWGQASPPAAVPSREAILVVQVDGEPDRVLLSRADADRLEALAARGRRTSGPAVAVARGVTHHLALGEGSRVLLRSRWDLLVLGQGAAEWTIPSGSLVDLRATVDGAPAALEMDAAAGLSRLRLEPREAERVVVEVEAGMAPRLEGWGSMEIPLRASALAEVVWTGGEAESIRFPNARGELAREPGSVRGGIGPVDRLVLERPGASSLVAPGSRLTSAEGLLLWDALPAGDRVRARFLVRGLAGARVVRVRLGPGMVVRAANLPGMEHSTLVSEGDAGIWTALVDPGVGSELALTLDLWRPGDASDSRTLPRVEVLGVDARTTTMGVRRPAGWTGRVEAVAGSEGVADEVFARQWGAFPEPPATLAGAIRFAETPAMTLRTAPVRARATVEATVRAQVEPGRLMVTAEGTIKQLEGQTREVQVQVPADWNVLRVSANGLTDWSRPLPERLRLRFDRGERADRLVRLEGWLPVASDPLNPKATSHRVPVPWPLWDGLEALAGTLAVGAPEGISVSYEPSPGVRAQAVKLTNLLPMPPASTSYRVAPAESSPGVLSWDDPPMLPRVSAVSAVTLYQNAAELAAVLQYNLSGGPLESLVISLPTAWSERVWLEAPGVRDAFVRETRGDLTVWTLTPSAPLWASQTLRVRATRSYDRSQRLEFPELLPRGRGEARFALALLDASGQSPVIQGSGVEDVEASSSLLAGLDLLPGVDRRVFRIARDHWQLAVQGLALSPTTRGETPVALASVQVTTSRTGQTVGVGRYELGTQVGPFLAFSVPTEVEVLGAAVDGLPVRPLRDPSGVCLVPLGSSPPNFARLVWSQKGLPDAHSGTVSLPQPVSQRGPTLLWVRGPSGREMRVSVASRLRESTSAELDVIEVGESAKLLADRVRSLDRSSALERAALLSALIRFDREYREAEQALLATEAASGSSRMKTARATVEAALRDASLEEFQQSAEARLEGAGVDPLRELPLYPEPVSTLAAPALGKVTSFHAPGRVAMLPDAVSWRDEAPERAADFALLVLCAGLCVAAFLLAGSWLADAVRRPGRLILLVILAGILAGLQPWSAALVIGAGVLGRCHPG